MSTKRKASLDKSTLPKKAKHWFTEGLDELSSIFNLRSYATLAFEQQRKKRDWVGAYPDPNSPEPTYTVRGKPEPVDADRDSPLHRHFYLDSVSSLDSDDDQEIVQGKPYRLEPYTKPPNFIPVDFRDRFSLFSPSTNDAARNGSISSETFSPLTSSTFPNSVGYRLQPSARFGPLGQSRFNDKSLLKARPRMYAGKTQRGNSFFQPNKYGKDNSTGQTPPGANDDSPVKQALDSTIGVLKSNRESVGDSRRGSTSSYGDEVAENRRLRASNQSLDGDELETERRPGPRQPAWLRTKYQGNREPAWLRNIRNLVSRNLPSIEKQQRTPGHQSVLDEHDRIEKEVAVALAPGKEDTSIVEGFNVQVLKKDIRTLGPGEWLNDEVINFYGNMIMARSKNSTTLPKVHYFKTFFYKTLSEVGYERVRRWTKKDNIFAMEYLLVPIHCSGNHWTSAVIDMKRKRVSYYDSLLGNNPKVFLILRDYLDMESRDKLKRPFDFDGWENECPKDIPRQRNGYDCGVFTCTFIEFKSRGAEKFEFSQDEMPYLRKKIVLNIINKSL
ncbi:SUMO1 sentrin specific peptidase 1 [Linnemannia gamsii]|uniref:SUMO1 sentrin specific peptidase 1 n=1 Tax=Linnemannia gamsii TaxID=64522 RepID=A0ABQ7K1P3_9FUNG|nr:SUMO1 sentrin specific peptidase 1 [Linnemannia gamsii]